MRDTIAPGCQHRFAQERKSAYFTSRVAETWQQGERESYWHTPILHQGHAATLDRDTDSFHRLFLFSLRNTNDTLYSFLNRMVDDAFESNREIIAYLTLL